MSKTIALQALKIWGMEDVSITLVAQRENLVYRILNQHSRQAYALRLLRKGLRNKAEISSESAWLQALTSGGLSVPVPLETQCGHLCIEIDGQFIDMQVWLAGNTLTHHSQPDHYRALGKAMARLHSLSDQWVLPTNFQRHAWDREGLLGDNPVWGRFWENTALDSSQQALMHKFKITASLKLQKLHSALDYGLIHADLVPDNVLVKEQQLHLIDFDDSGFGYRLFDLATVVLRLQRDPEHNIFIKALIQGYAAERKLDLEALDLFLAVRACTYIGWIIPRRKELGGDARCARFIETGCLHASNWLAVNY